MRASRGEIKIHEILEANDINFKEEYEFAGLKAPSGRPLRFDFAVFDEVPGETSLKIVVHVREPAGVGARELSPVLGFRGGLRRARNRVLTFRTARDACQTCNNDAENRHYAANTDDNISQHRLPITCTHANSPCRTSAVARARLRMTFDMLEPTCRKLSSVFHHLMSTSAHAANTPPVLQPWNMSSTLPRDSIHLLRSQYLQARQRATTTQ